MDDVNGEMLDISSRHDWLPILTSTTEALKCLGSLSGQDPGPLGGAPVRGLLWTDRNEIHFNRRDGPQNSVAHTEYFAVRIRSGSGIESIS